MSYIRVIFLLCIISCSISVPHVFAVGLEQVDTYIFGDDVSFFYPDNVYFVDKDYFFVPSGDRHKQDVQVMKLTEEGFINHVTTLTQSFLDVGTFNKFTVHEGYLYSYGNDELVVFDIADPKNPVEKKRLSGLSVYTGIATVIEDVLYVHSYNKNVISLFDIADPKNITLLSEISLDSSFHVGQVLAKNEKYLFVSNAQYSTTPGIDVYNIENLTFPIYVRSYIGDEYEVPQKTNFKTRNHTLYYENDIYYLARMHFGSDGVVTVEQIDIPFGIDKKYTYDQSYLYLQGMSDIAVVDVAQTVPEQVGHVPYNDNENLRQLNTMFFVNQYLLVLSKSADAEENIVLSSYKVQDHIYRFYSEIYNGHFYTSSFGEKESIKTNDKNWMYEGVAYSAVSNNDKNAFPIYRFWSDNYQHHFYTISQSERDHIITHDKNWMYEGVAYSAYATQQVSTQAVYRFWSDVFRGHFYTSSKAEKDYIETYDTNWAYEGVAWWVPA